jgi:hypothetical protein
MKKYRMTPKQKALQTIRDNRKIKRKVVTFLTDIKL